MRRILVIIDYYLPGYKAGGPTRTIANMVERLGDEFGFHIITSDRDLGESHPYPGIKVGSWESVGKAHVLYLPSSKMSFLGWYRLLKGLQYDLIYLNSFFSRLSIKTIMLRRMRLLPKKPVVLAPRGEFSPGALSLKSFKKHLYILLAKYLGLYSGVIWQASSEYEMKDILSVFGIKAMAVKPSVQIAPDLPPLLPQDSELGERPIKQRGSARIVFLSRIARMKNLDFAIKLLTEVNGKVEFDIYGPIEDQMYWGECQHLIELLPDNISVSYCGMVPPDRASYIFSQYHLFLFPTRGENFGHVILEALNAGCPVLTSDQTPWSQLATRQAGWSLPLSEPERFRIALNKLISMDQCAFGEMSQRARSYARDFSGNPDLVRASRDLFLKALGM